MREISWGILLVGALLLLPAALSGGHRPLKFALKPPLSGVQTISELAKTSESLQKELAQLTERMGELEKAAAFPRKQQKGMVQILRSLKEQEEKLHQAVALLHRVRKQTQITRQLVNGTLEATLRIEGHSRANEKYSRTLQEELQKSAQILSSLNQALSVSEKTFQSLQNKLPKNLPL